jgi:molybdenum cofactor cytidylyltransferase
VTVAVVPACGHSSRMGRPKLSLPVGDRTVIEHVVRALLEGGVSRVLVVAGPHVPELVPLASRAGADILQLPEPTSDMRETVERGLAWFDEVDRPNPVDWWLLTPGDQPALSTAVVRELLDAAAVDLSYSIVVPVHEGRRGHPVLLRWRHVSGIRSLPPGEGINAYLGRHRSETREVPVDNSGIHADLDTPEDYQRLAKRW